MSSLQKFISGFALGLAILSPVEKLSAQLSPSQETSLQTMVGKMTLEEKVGQMAQITLDVIGVNQPESEPFRIDTGKLKEAVNTYKLGSVLNTSNNKALTAQAWNEIVAQIQDEAAATRMKVPVIYGFDAIHGVTYMAGATFFPQEIGQAATWNRDLVRQGAVITAYEARAAGVPWNFSPVLDLGINPLWPRFWETMGEDPYLVTELGLQMVKGYQDPLTSREKVAACLKHFFAYSDPRSGKDRTNAWIPEYYLREYFLPPFVATLKAGARTVMVNSSLINGVPMHINRYWLTDVLKKELQFDGVVVTDWQDIENVFKRDHVARDMKEAIMLSINAGIDMSMIPYNYKEFCDNLVALVKEGKVTQARIDDAVTRILRLKMELGLFSTPVTFAKDYPKLGSREFEMAARRTAAESITLLKNTGNLLPLSSGTKILVTGPNANSMRTLNGGWSYSWQGEKTEQFARQYNTILEAAIQKFGEQNVSYAPGVAYKMEGKYFEDSIVDMNAAIDAARQADVILLCLGENSYTEKPGDLQDLNLSIHQLSLANAMMATGKKVILVLNEGRPRIISNIEPGMAAIVNVYLPGNYGGDALAAILAGEVNPSGKLPFTYPRYVNALTNYIHKPSDEQSNPQGAYDYSADFNPQYPFGYGLSYTEFSYSDLSIDKSGYDDKDLIRATVTVKNTGNRAGSEVVQLYTSDLYATLTPDVKRLRGFEKIFLEPGASKQVQFTIPVAALAFVNTDNQWLLEAGEFMLQIQNLSKKFTVSSTRIVKK